MGFYVITDGNGSYIHRNSDNKFVTIRSMKQATQWDNIVKANTVLNNSIPKVSGLITPFSYLKRNRLLRKTKIKPKRYVSVILMTAISENGKTNCRPSWMPSQMLTSAERS